MRAENWFEFSAFLANVPKDEVFTFMNRMGIASRAKRFGLGKPVQLYYSVDDPTKKWTRPAFEEALKEKVNDEQNSAPLTPEVFLQSN